MFYHKYANAIGCYVPFTEPTLPCQPCQLTWVRVPTGYRLQNTVVYTTDKNNENINDSLMEVQSCGRTINSVLYPVFNITVFSL